MDLVTAARKGREKAFLELFDEHHVALFRFAFRLTGSVSDAEDIVQECFLELLRPTCRYNASRGSVRTWLFGVARNQSLKRLRKRAESEWQEATDVRSPETEALRNELNEMIGEALAQLPDTQREVLILAHFEKIPLADIAALLEIEVGAVKSRLQRARTTLKDTLAGCRSEKK
jgi:RNA polymerase sigma-70 factor (ECF subfamily)